MTSAARAATLRPPGTGLAPVTARVPEDPAVRVAFTGRRLEAVGDANLSLVVGDREPHRARRAALALVGVGPDAAVFMEQVHGGEVAAVDADDAGRGATSHDDAIRGADAMVTTATDVALAVLVADCVPVVLVDPGRAVGVAHAGRGGVMAGVVPAAVQRLTDTPGRVVAIVGPAIGGCCYEVPADMATDVTAVHPDAAATTSWGTPSLDLPAAVVAQLTAAGVSRVDRLGGCTRCDGDAWFSHRAASGGTAPHGRQAGLVVRLGSAADAPHPTPDRSSLESR